MPLPQQVYQGVGLLEHLQVLPLEVFQQGQHGAVLGGALCDDSGNLLKPRQLAGPQPALPGDERVAPVLPPHGHRLEQPVLLDALGQALQGGLVKVLAGLGWIGQDAADRQFHQLELVLKKHVPRLPFVMYSITGKARRLLFPVGPENFTGIF